MNNSKEMKDKSILLLSENEIKVLECIKINVIIGAKETIEQTQISDRTARWILKKMIDSGIIDNVCSNKKDRNKKFKIKE